MLVDIKKCRFEYFFNQNHLFYRRIALKRVNELAGAINATQHQGNTALLVKNDVEAVVLVNHLHLQNLTCLEFELWISHTRDCSKLTTIATL